MKRIIAIVLLSAVAVIFVLFYVAFNGDPITKYIIKRDTRVYLEKKGYKKADIASIKAVYEMKGNTDRVSGTVANVIFKDEPNETYTYVKHRKDNRILQHCEYYNRDTDIWEVEFSPKRKHMERACTEMY